MPPHATRLPPLFGTILMHIYASYWPWAQSHYLGWSSTDTHFQDLVGTMWTSSEARLLSRSLSPDFNGEGFYHPTKIYADAPPSIFAEVDWLVPYIESRRASLSRPAMPCSLSSWDYLTLRLHTQNTLTRSGGTARHYPEYDHIFFQTHEMGQQITRRHQCCDE